MLGYILKRCGAAVIVLFLVSVFTYVIFFALSPDPALQICGKTCNPERIAQIHDQLGLDQPLWKQYWEFASGLFVGRDYGTGSQAIHCSAPCLGYSFQTNEAVMDMVSERLPVTATVAIGAAVLWLLGGVMGGVISAFQRGKFWDKFFNAIALGGISLPNYFVALLLQYILVVQLQILPFPQAVPFSENPGRWFAAYLMPWMVLAFQYMAIYTRLTRSNVIDTLNQNFMRTARAKGLKPSLVVGRHALRPALTPVTTMFGMDFAALLGGALITETVFGLNGIGKLTSDSITKNDQPVIMAVTLLAAAFVVIANILVDIGYRYLDPRVRVKSS